jgi:thiol-disulfide isomerase/thioredoxin
MCLSRVFFCLLVCAGCGSTGDLSQPDVPVGWIDREVLANPAHGDFSLVYDTSRIHEDFVGLIQQVHEGIDVIVFLGTWCSDSRREVPRFLKIADLAGMNVDRIKLYGLDRTKKSRDGLTDRYGIERVPTFIFLLGEREVGRIVEVPRTTLEGDVLSILAGARGTK